MANVTPPVGVTAPSGLAELCQVFQLGFMTFYLFLVTLLVRRKQCMSDLYGHTAVSKHRTCSGLHVIGRFHRSAPSFGWFLPDSSRTDPARRPPSELQSCVQHHSLSRGCWPCWSILCAMKQQGTWGEGVQNADCELHIWRFQFFYTPEKTSVRGWNNSERDEVCFRRLCCGAVWRCGACSLRLRGSQVCL